MNRSSLKSTLYRSSLALVILATLLSACRAKPVVPTTLPPTSTPQTSAATATPAVLQNINSWSKIDDGSPLPPQVVEQQPSNGQSLSLDGEITLVFNQPMDQDKTKAAWQMTDVSGEKVAGKVTWATPRTLSFKAAQMLKTGSVYIASLSNQAVSAQGVPLADPLTLQFNTVGELQVSQVFPAEGAEQVTNDTVITVIFNRPVVPLVILEDKSKLPNPISISPEISGAGEWVNTSVYAFKPDANWQGSTNYVVTVKAGLKDAAEESQLAQDYTWGFSTIAPSIADFEFSNGYINPDNFYKNVLLDTYFTIRFNQPMDQASAEAALSLTSSSGEKALYTASWNQDFTQVVYTPTQRLALGADYLLKVDASAQAASGGALGKGLDWNFTTVPLPAVESITPQDDSVASLYSGEVRIKFASPMNIDSVKSRIQITPKPDKAIEWWYNEWDWSIVSYALKPSTKYTLRLLPGMQDIYGNQIRQGQTVSFTTAAYSPQAGLQMPYEPALWRTDGPQEFYANYLNIKTVTYKLYKLSTDQFVNLITGNTALYQYQPPESALVWQKEEKSTAKLNELTLKGYKPVPSGKDALEPGFYFLGMVSPQVEHSNSPWVDQRMLMVANANLTFKSTTTDTLMWVTGLTSGEPLKGVPVTVYDKGFQPIGEGSTDEKGMLYLEVPAPGDPYENRFAMADDGQVFGFAASQWGSGVSTWDYGIWSSYYAPANQPTAYVYTERPIYRPGQPVYFKGILRLDNDLDYSLPDQSTVKVKISNYQDTVYEETLSLSSYGSFSGQFTLDTEAALGGYYLEVYQIPQINGEQQMLGSVSFTVAEYRRPEYQVLVSAEPLDVRAGENFTVKVQADYYSGGGVSDAEVNWSLTAENFFFTPPDELSAYNFSDYEEDNYYSSGGGGGGSEIIAEGVGRTDASGQFALTLPADLSKVSTSLRLIFEATVTDLSQNAVSGRAEVVAHRSAVYPGIRASTYVGAAGEEQSFEVVAVDWDGKLLPGQKVSVEIVERRWNSVQEQDSDGRITWKTDVEEIPVTKVDDVTLDEKGKATVAFTPSNGGIFRARVTALDTLGNAGRASAYMWVAGKDYIPWRQTNDRSFDLVTDRKSYKPGDTAEILIASPFQGQAYALVTVERGRMHYQDVILLENNSTIYKLPISADLAPNAYVSVLVVKGVDKDSPRPNFKMGIIEINVDTRQQTLTVELAADREEVGPGETVNYTVRTLDFQGKPVQAEVSLSLSDLATLSLLPPNSQPILDYFYSERTLGVWTSVPINLSIEEYNTAITPKDVAQGAFAGGGGGGKGGGELGVVAVRQDFPDTAFWEAHIVTGSDGQATVSVKLPDNLTTWRMDARAATEDTHVGQTTLDIISTKPLLVRPQTPRFFVVEDQATLATAVHNNTDQALSVKVSLSAEGLALSGEASQTVEIAANGKAYVTWQATVNPDAQRVDLIFSAEGGGYTDASRPPAGTLENQGIPVYRYDVRETVGTSGQMLEGGTRIEAISLPTSFDIAQGEMTIEVAPSLAAGMTQGLKYLEHYPYECIEQTISRFLPNVITTRALKSAGISDASLEGNVQVDTALQRLYNWQNGDGGWSWWHGDESHPLVSAYVVLGLIEAQDAGYQVSSSVFERGVGYLRNQIISITRLVEPYKLNRQAFILYVLARSGKPDVSATVQIYDQRQNMALYAQAFLAQTLSIIDASDPRLKTLLSDLSSAAIVSATGSHWEEKEVDYWNWNTDTRTTAIVLSALSHLDTQNPLNSNAVRWLMSHRQDGHWSGTQETAWTLMALANWMVASGELAANYQYAIALNGEQIGSGVADTETLRETYEISVDVSNLLKEEANRLAFARDDGPGNLYYTAHMSVYLPVEQVQAVDQGISVSRSYYRLDDLKTPVTQAQQGEMLLTRLTLVAPSSLHYVIIDDPLPAGLEAVDQSLSTSPQSVEVPQVYSWDDIFWRGWGWWWFTYTQMRDEKVVLSANYLPTGTYVYTYLVRASTVGVFKTIPPTAQEFYFPEVYGRGDGSLFTVAP